MVTRINAGAADVKTAMALLHTIKGTSAIWGLTSVATVAHALESHVVDTEGVPSTETLVPLNAAWDAIMKLAASFLGAGRGRVEVSRTDLDKVIALAKSRVASDELVRNIEALKHEPAGDELPRISDQVGRLAERLEKPVPRIITDANDVRLPASRFGAFWASSVHVIRNIMDHGIESPGGAVGCGKNARRAHLLARVPDARSNRVELSDDGRGIAWDSVAKKARELGMPWKTREDLKRALFSSGFSTKAEATDISGRGVGLSAVAESCAELGGFVEIESTAGRGTRFMFSFPARKKSALAGSLEPKGASRELVFREASRRGGE